MRGFYSVYKPIGYSSFDVIRVLRKAYNMRTWGHSGTLDPFAEGLMILACGVDTRFLERLIGLTKQYSAVFELGILTDTLDSTGVIIPHNHHSIPTYNDIEDALRTLINSEYMQLPPLYSALKIDGQRAYDMARKGIDIGLQKRLVKLYDATILHYEYPFIHIDMTVSSGFYVRSLARDIAHICSTEAICKHLKRTKIGDYTMPTYTNYDIVNTLTPIDVADINPNITTIYASLEDAKRLHNGQYISLQTDIYNDTTVFYRDNYNNIIAEGYVMDSVFKPKKVVPQAVL